MGKNKKIKKLKILKKYFSFYPFIKTHFEIHLDNSENILLKDFTYR